MSAAEEHPRLASAVDLLLLHCLESCGQSLEARQAAPLHAERAQLLNTCIETMEADSRRALGRVFELVRAFDVVPGTTWLQQQIDTFVDRASAHVMEVLAVGGAHTTPSEQRQVANVRSRIKARCREEVAREVGAAQQQRARASTENASAGDLDDRLPLRRRGAFDRDLAELVAAARRDGACASLVMIDVDHFKNVNDEHGHPVGDEVLLELARRVVARMGDKGRAYRYGGEELALLLRGYSADEAAGLAERLRKDVAARPMSSKAVVVTASFGVASLPEHGTDGPTLLARADEALYAAKRGGRNRVHVAP
jgi:diguanylate cyclase (GGDEF)-like protein